MGARSASRPGPRSAETSSHSASRWIAQESSAQGPMLPRPGRSDAFDTSSAERCRRALGRRRQQDATSPMARRAPAPGSGPVGPRTSSLMWEGYGIAADIAEAADREYRPDMAMSGWLARASCLLGCRCVRDAPPASRPTTGRPRLRRLPEARTSGPPRTFLWPATRAGGRSGARRPLRSARRGGDGGGWRAERGAERGAVVVVARTRGPELLRHFEDSGLLG